jgi:acetoin utilization protein AcuC
MPVALVWDDRLATYRFPTPHPMQPERFVLAVETMRSWGLLAEATETSQLDTGGEQAIVLVPRSASDEELLLAHDAQYVAHVRAASVDPAAASGVYGLGAGDTPAFAGMHEAAALAVGASVTALDAVTAGRVTRAFSPAGGLHHAKRASAAGFCIFNDCVVAIERATRRHPGLRVAYIDIDAHHGDGVEAAFYGRADVFTASIHESGQFVFPGTGAARDTGEGAGRGSAMNVPLLPHAGDDEFLEALASQVVPALRRFGPDVIVAQLGADTHHGDPLTHLDMTTAGFLAAVASIRDLADEICAGRLVAVGGGGYQPLTVVPRMWAGAMAVLLDRAVPPETLSEP